MQALLPRCVVQAQDQTATRARGAPRCLLLQQRLVAVEVSECFESEIAVGSFETYWCSMARVLRERAMRSYKCRFYLSSEVSRETSAMSCGRPAAFLLVMRSSRPMKGTFIPLSSTTIFFSHASRSPVARGRPCAARAYPNGLADVSRATICDKDASKWPSR